MEQKMERKNFPALGLKITDADEGIVEHVITVFGIVDHGLDISHPGSFTKTIQERGNQVLVLDQHRRDSAMAIVGKPLSLREVDRADLPLKIQSEYPEATGGVLATTQFLMDTPEGKGIFIRIKEDALREWSYGYEVLDMDNSTMTKDGEEITVRNLRTVRLYEYSPVLWGMNQATMVMGAKGDEDDEAGVGNDSTPPEAKPYGIFEVDDEYCVYRVDEDGKRFGDAFGCHATEAEATDQIQAIYASENAEQELDDEHKDELEGSTDTVIVQDPDTNELDDDPDVVNDDTIITITVIIPKGREKEVLEALHSTSSINLLNVLEAPEPSEPVEPIKSDDQAASEAGPVLPPTSNLLQRLEIEQAQLELLLEGLL